MQAQVDGQTAIKKPPALPTAKAVGFQVASLFGRWVCLAARRTESPSTLLEQLKRIHQQTVQATDGKSLTGLTEITPEQKSLFAALELTLPTPSDLDKPAF